MGMKFNDLHGSAKKAIDNQYKFKDGDNVFRIIGEVMPRYVYWLKGDNGKDIPMECLSFDRKAEKFLNAEHDYVREYLPLLKCSWSYVSYGIEPGDKPKLVVINHKKKLFQAIKTLAEDLGDPTDLETGWDIAFKKKKTGAAAFNVEYELQQLRCKKRSLSEEEKALLVDLKPLEELIPRPTPEIQKAFLERMSKGDDETGEEEEAKPEDVGSLDDLPQ